MLRCVILVRPNVSEEFIAYIIRVAGIGELGTTLAVTSKQSMLRSVVPSSPILVNLMMEAILSSETSVLKRSTRHIIPEDGILHVTKIYYCWKI
jgi:hypothetical protein